ncbi:flagellar hook-associated protein FlgK [Pseudoalteromonas sp. SSDWG2]|uniref:flagellar hook-associated protein FlgK n=1 Tax=Pseudoalteromonas sp. SSDWG2 TaxID=3139391 RepID=UPI003BAB19C2
MSFSLLNIASSGIRANTELLNTTSKNIANVNTEGYVRERTEHSTIFDNQVGRGETFRLLNEFAQRQLNRDTSNRSFFERFMEEAQRVDSQFSEESNSLSTQLNGMFNNLQEALNQPSSSVTRSLFFTNAQNYVDQLNRLGGMVAQQQTIVNDQVSILAGEANELIEKISELNIEIAGVHGTDAQDQASTVYNERDKAIKELSELMNVETLDGQNGEKLVFMSTGEAIVMENGTFNLFSLRGDPDPNLKELRLDVTKGDAISLEVDASALRGEIGGILAYRDEVLIPAQNQLGQLALSLADAFNQQNHLGMDANGEIGEDLFILPTANGLAHTTNTGTADLVASLEPGFGANIPATDFRITYTSATTVEIVPLNNKGEPVGTPSTADIVAGVIDSTTVTSGESFGLQINVTGAGAAGDEFDIKLNAAAATQMELATMRPEKLALALPIRTSTSINNISEASISPGEVTDIANSTGITIGPPPSLTNGPITLVKTANSNEYSITDGNGTTTFTITPPADNILAQAGAPYNTYGFDFNIEGSPQAGDEFTLEFNTGGFDDNRNGLKLSGLQSQDLVRENVLSSTTADNLKTFNQAFAGIVTDIGIVTDQAKTSFAAFSALEDQSNAWYESMAGVNLDEEAANLLRFQQSYSASARILTTAQTVFDTLLSSAR